MCSDLIVAANHSLCPCRLYGGFEALKGGKTSEAMEDFTGGVVETFELAKAENDLFEKILRNAARATLMSCSIA